MIILKVLGFFKYIEIKKRYDVFYAKVSLTKMQNLAIFIINLERSTRRKQQMQQQMAKLNLDYEFYTAIDGNRDYQQLIINVDAKQFRRNMGLEVLPGEIGCYCSHLAVWHKFLISGKHDHLLVLEDDVKFGEDFEQALKLALQAPQHWDILKLNAIRAKQPIKQGNLDKFSINACLGPLTGFGAYLINRKTIELMLPEVYPMQYPIDHFIDKLSRWQIQHFALLPFPSYIDDDGVSSINGENRVLVKKPPKYKRLYHYASRLCWQLHRFYYFVIKGWVFSKNNNLLK